MLDFLPLRRALNSLARRPPVSTSALFFLFHYTLSYSSGIRPIPAPAFHLTRFCYINYGKGTQSPCDQELGAVEGEKIYRMEHLKH